MNIINYLKSKKKVFDNGFKNGSEITARQYQKKISEIEKKFLKEQKKKDNEIKKLKNHVKKIDNNLDGYIHLVEEMNQALDEAKRNSIKVLKELSEQQQPILNHTEKITHLHRRLVPKTKKTKKLIKKGGLVT